MGAAGVEGGWSLSMRKKRSTVNSSAKKSRLQVVSLMTQFFCRKKIPYLHVCLCIEKSGRAHSALTVMIAREPGGGVEGMDGKFLLFNFYLLKYLSFVPMGIVLIL